MSSSADRQPRKPRHRRRLGRAAQCSISMRPTPFGTAPSRQAIDWRTLPCQRGRTAHLPIRQPRTTSSALARSEGGMLMPSCWAAFASIASVNFDACSMGRPTSTTACAIVGSARHTFELSMSIPCVAIAAASHGSPAARHHVPWAWARAHVAQHMGPAKPRRVTFRRWRPHAFADLDGRRGRRRRSM